MTSDDPLFVFLDANVLAKHVTRTLILRCAASGYTAVWSATAEAEADRHLSERQFAVAELRAIVGLELSKSGTMPERFADTSEGDRQILADAEASGATFLVTEDVDDFAYGDLRAVGISAVNPDLFLAERAESETYRRALEVMVSGMRNPSRTPAELHAAIARQHPRLFGRHQNLFQIEPQRTGHRHPATIYRGLTCLRCLTRQVDEGDLVDGIGPECGIGAMPLS